MHIAQVRDWSKGPEYLTVPDPPAPNAEKGEVQLRVLAAGLHQVVRSRASGSHYSTSSSAGGLPHTPGIDFVGQDVSTGSLYYAMINMQDPSAGSFAEVINVPRSSLYPLSLPLSQNSNTGTDEDNEAEQAASAAAVFAGSVNPAMSAWLALKHRADYHSLPKNFTVLILGATSASGRLAARVAKHLGAGRVIGVARNEAVLASMKGKGLDEYVVVRGEGSSDDTGSSSVKGTDFSHLSDVDVVLDYVYGDLAMHLLSTIPVAPGRPMQYVMVGGLSGQFDVAFPAAALRSKNITVRGSGPGAISFPVILAELRELVGTMAEWGQQQQQLLDNVRAVPLKDIETVWHDRELQKKHRLVFIP